MTTMKNLVGRQVDVMMGDVVEGSWDVWSKTTQKRVTLTAVHAGTYEGLPHLTRPAFFEYVTEDGETGMIDCDEVVSKLLPITK